METATEVCKTRTSTQVNLKTPWFTDEGKEVFKEEQKAYLKYMTIKSPDDLTHYKK